MATSTNIGARNGGRELKNTMLTTPDKICILSPGRCGSQYLLSLLGIHFCNRPWDLEHTHNLEYALELERQDFEVITVRRYGR